MYTEVKSLNPVTPFTLITVYKQSGTKSVLPFTLLSASFFMCRRREGREGVAAGQTEAAWFAVNCDPQILGNICGKEQLLYPRTILLVFSTKKEIIKGFFFSPYLNLERKQFYLFFKKISSSRLVFFIIGIYYSR